MKKFIKVFIIVLLVIGVIGGTCFFFFRKHKDKNSKTESIVSMLQSESKIKFDEDLSLITGYMKDSNSADTRLDLIINTSGKLDDILSVLSSYYVSANTQIKNEEIVVDNEPIAIITIQDNIRPDARETIEWFNKNDVCVKIISGDNIDTVSSISKKVGVENADKCISLEGLSEEEVKKAALEYNVFGRVTPEQKFIIVKALKAAEFKVAMTGDGVNDILALKEADCSIAMASGSEATRSASNLVMLENNFSAMPKIVAEGRRVINNISKASSLFLTKTFFVMFLTIFALMSPLYNYP